MSEKFDPHPAPDVEEEIDGDGDWQQKAVEAHAPAGAAFGEVVIDRSGVKQTEERHYWDESHHGGQREHNDREFSNGLRYQCRTQNLDGYPAEASTPASVQLMYLSLSVTILLPEGSC